MACQQCGGVTENIHFSLCKNCWQAKQALSGLQKNRLVNENCQLKFEVARLTALIQEIFKDLNDL